MTEQHPITPPPELVKQWDAECESGNNAEINSTFDALQQFACKAARWGSDQELEACCDFLELEQRTDYAALLRAARRPKPPSLKEQALKAALIELDPTGKNGSLILRALEALPDD